MAHREQPSGTSSSAHLDQHDAPDRNLDPNHPLDEAPAASVKSRARSKGSRRSASARRSAAASLNGNTPEGTPAQQDNTPAGADAPASQPIPVDDEKDNDYVPAVKKRARSTRASAIERQRDLYASPVIPLKTPASIRVGDKLPNGGERVYDAEKLKLIVDAAKKRALADGKTGLAAAVEEIHRESLRNMHLTNLLEAVLTRTATPTQTEQFTTFVRRAKSRLKAAKKIEAAATKESRKQPADQALPLRSPSKQSTPFAEPSADPVPSTEKVESSKPKLQIKVKSPPQDSRPRRRLGQNASMTEANAKRRERPGSEESELTDLTSGDEAGKKVNGASSGRNPSHTRSSRVNGVSGKDHAAERGTLAAPDRKQLKRSSTEAELVLDERESAIVAKKQKLAESVTREVPFQESDMRQGVQPQRTSSRATRGKIESSVPPSIQLQPNGIRAGSRKGSRAPSTAPGSPLSDLSPPSSRMSTPHALRMPPKPPAKRAKTKTSPEKKQLAGNGGASGASGAGRESPIGDDDNEELSENNDFCSACGGSGFLLCCDGCDRSFHFSCLDPPLNEDASELNEPWYCFVCVARRPVVSDTREKPTRGLFAALLNNLKKRNPSNFSLPEDIRNYYEAVQTDKNGAFVEAVTAKPRNRAGYDELPDYYKIKDSKGHTVLCYYCSKSSAEQGRPPRQIIQCDFCSASWHLDCLDPPLANPPARSFEGKKIHDWMCPLHADHELREVPTTLLAPRRRVHLRRPRNAKVFDTFLNRGFRNHGVIDVAEDDSDDSDSEFYDEEAQDEAVVYRMPANGIKLDFIDKVKNARIAELEEAIRQERAVSVYNAATPPQPSIMQQENFVRRSFAEKQTALNLTQFASINHDLELSANQVENLLGTLIAEAPSEVVNEYRAAENEAAKKNLSSMSSAIPPSPPNSDQTDQLTAEQRKELLMLQELIRRRLEGAKT